MKEKTYVIITSLLISISSSFALEMECSNTTGTVLKLKGDNSSASNLSTGDLIRGDLSSAYHLALDVSGVISNDGEDTEVADSLMMLRRGRVIHTANEGISLYWNSESESYLGQIGEHSGEFKCSLEDL